MNFRILNQVQDLRGKVLYRKVVLEITDEINLEGLVDPDAVKFTRRERQVLGLVELSNKEIAQRLNLSERTVKFHVSSLLKKTGSYRRADLWALNLVVRTKEAA